jgi:HAD superfamily hydrolase (TIGR01450 family)
MVKINGIPIIEHQIKAYLKAGLKKKSIFIVVGYESEIIKDFIEKNYFGIKIIENKNYLNTNNMYSLYLALQCIENLQFDYILLSNGDCVYDTKIIRDLNNNSELNLIACDKGFHNNESMKIRVMGENIVDISKEIPADKSYGVSIDLYKISLKSLLKLKKIIQEYIFVKKQCNLWTEVSLKDLLDYTGFKPFNIQRKSWVEIDDLADLALADIKFSNLKIEDKKCFIMDLDGTVYLGKKPINGTINFIKKYMEKGVDFYFLTNNTSKVPSDYVNKLRGMNIDVQENNILTPLFPLLNYLNENEIKKMYCIGNSNFVHYLKNNLESVKITEDFEECEAVILAYDTELTYEKLEKASLLLQNNNKILFLATHIDIFCPTEKGNIPDIGCMMLVIEKTTNKVPDMIFGKPNPVILDSIQNKYNKEDVVVVGDRLKTDKKLADNLDYDFICVLTGETNRLDLEKLDYKTYPSMVIKDLSDLL